MTQPKMRKTVRIARESAFHCRGIFNVLPGDNDVIGRIDTVASLMRIAMKCDTSTTVNFNGLRIVAPAPSFMARAGPPLIARIVISEVIVASTSKESKLPRRVGDASLPFTYGLDARGLSVVAAAENWLNTMGQGLQAQGEALELFVQIWNTLG